MAKKAEIKKINPGDAARSLEEYHIRVVTLVHFAETLIINNLVDSKFSEELQNRINSVKEFFNKD